MSSITGEDDADAENLESPQKRAKVEEDAHAKASAAHQTADPVTVVPPLRAVTVVPPLRNTSMPIPPSPPGPYPYTAPDSSAPNEAPII